MTLFKAISLGYIYVALSGLLGWYSQLKGIANPVFYWLLGLITGTFVIAGSVKNDS